MFILLTNNVVNILILLSIYQPPTTLEQSAINSGFNKSYGSLASNESVSEKLIYSWYNLDVFGEVNQPGSNWKQIVNRVRGVFCNERHIPKPRKHLIKNGKFQRYMFINLQLTPPPPLSLSFSLWYCLPWWTIGCYGQLWCWKDHTT